MIRDGKQYKLDYDIEGNPLLINLATGEAIQGAYRPMFPGDKLITPAQQDANRKYVDSLLKAAGRRTASKDLGSYFFIIGNQQFSDLKPQTAARLIYLQTFCTYAEEKGNRLKLNTKQDMRRDDLPKTLRLSKDAVDDFWAEVSPHYLSEDGNGLIFSNTKVFVKGTINQGSKYYRAYVRGVRKLYEATIKTRHRHLGYLFKLLPFVNIEFNALCFNPEEQDAELIEFMTLDDLCNMIGYEKNRRDRLLKIYKQLTFEVKDKDGTHFERFLSITGDGLNNGKQKLYINPRILYSGSDYKQVAILGGFCKG